MNSSLGKKPSCDQIINILPDPFVVIDRSFTIIAANRHYLKHYGYQNAEQVVGRYCYEISHHVDSPCSEHGEHCPLETVFETGQPAQVLHIHYDKSGEEEHVQLNSNPLFDEDGNVLYVGEYIHPLAQPSENALLIGRSRAMMRMIGLLQRVAPTQTSVLLLGESGVGKECVSQYIHQFSSRSNMPFVIIDCGTLGESLIESELFGHEKGAFTGAAARKKGLFEAADGGTLFIDEIAELPLALQTKLLRALETGTIRRIGGTDYMNVDVRVIAATNRDLKEMVEKGEFREDLYYRLSAFPITIPSLRDRHDDIPALAEHFLSRTDAGERFLPLSPEVLEALMMHDYPGNVRELRNVMERAAILAAGEEFMLPEHILTEGRRRRDEGSVNESPKLPHKLIERRSGRLSLSDIMNALTEANGHRADAARMLGISERTLYRYVQKLRDSLLDEDDRLLVTETEF